MTGLSFRLVCVPPTTSHHHKKIARVGNWTRLVDRDELVKAKGLIEELLIPHQPPAPIVGPVVLTVEYTWPWLASHSRKVRAQGRIPHISKPDLTNVTKTLEDRLTDLLFIEDDRKVVDLRVRKWWGDTPGIDITIAPFVDIHISPAPPITAAASSPLFDEEGVAP